MLTFLGGHLKMFTSLLCSIEVLPSTTETADIQISSIMNLRGGALPERKTVQDLHITHGLRAALWPLGIVIPSDPTGLIKVS